jgi:nitrogen fixation protein FixH
MSRALTGRDVLLWLVAGFALVIAVNAAFIVISLRTYPGEDEQRPYLQGIAYNHTLAARAKQAELGWRATIGASRLPNGRVLIAVALVRSDGTPEPQAVLAGELRHPSDESRDIALSLSGTRRGEYRGELDGVASGFWDVVIKSSAPQPFEAVRRVWVP